MRFDWKQRLAGRAIKHVNEALLGGLRDCVDLLPIVRHRDQRWRRWEIAVPNIVMDALKMPDTLAGFSVERQLAVGK